MNYVKIVMFLVRMWLIDRQTRLFFIIYIVKYVFVAPQEPMVAAAASAATFMVPDFDTENRPYKCPICRKRFGKAAILKRHHLAHFRPYNCTVCERSFTRREVLAEHLQEHNGEDLRLPCPVCAMTIKRKRNLQAHIKVKHPAYYQLKRDSKESLF